MTDPTSPTIRPDRPTIARALWVISNLMLAMRVELVEIWRATGIAEHVLRIDVTGYPVECDELVAAMGAVDHEEWTGGPSGQIWTEWTGELLTMKIMIQRHHVPVTSDPATAAAPLSAARAYCLGAPDDREADCGTSGPHDTHLITDPEQAEPVPVDLLEEQPLIEQPEPEPGLSTAELQAKYADFHNVLVVPGRPGPDDPEVRAAWSRYAQARALHEFYGRSFPTVREAELALDQWAGRDMLEWDDVTAVAAQLVDQDVPAHAPARDRGKLLDFMPRFARRRARTEAAL